MEALIGSLLVMVWLILMLVWALTFVGPARRAIARGILAPYHIPLRRFRLALGVSAVVPFVIVVVIASESPDKQSSPSAPAITAPSPIALATPAPAVSESAPSEQTSSQGQGPAYDLAVIQEGHTVDPTDLSVAHFQEVLNVLSGRYRETPQQIADETVKAQQLLAAKGLNDSLDDITTGMEQASISASNAGIAYAQALALYIVLREGGAAKG